MAQLAIGIAGGLAATALGGPFGLGFAVASFAASRLLGPGLPTIYGPRVTNLDVQSSAHGTPKIRLHGTHKAPAQIIYSSGIRETSSRKSISGKGFLSPSQTVVSFKYDVDAGLFWAEGPMGAILEIEADGKKVVDNTTTTGPVSNKGIWRHYLGTETQSPDPMIQADKGIDSTPAYRGDCYSTVEKLPLEDFGNRLPNFTAIIASEASAAAPVTNVTLGHPGQSSPTTGRVNRDAGLMIWENGTTDGWGMFAPDAIQQLGGATWNDALNEVFETIKPFGPLQEIEAATLTSNSAGGFALSRTGDYCFGLSLGRSSTSCIVKAHVWSGTVLGALGREENFFSIGLAQKSHDIITGWSAVPFETQVGSFGGAPTAVITFRTWGITYGRDFGGGLVSFESILDELLPTDLSSGTPLIADPVNHFAQLATWGPITADPGWPVIDREGFVWIVSNDGGSPLAHLLNRYSVYTGDDAVASVDITAAIAGLAVDEVDLVYKRDTHELLMFSGGYAWKYDIDAEAFTGAALQVYNHTGLNSFKVWLLPGPDSDGVMITRGDLTLAFGADNTQAPTMNRFDVDAWAVESGKYSLTDYGATDLSQGAVYVRSLNAYVGQDPPTMRTLFLDRVTDTTKALSDIITDVVTREGEWTAADIDVTGQTSIAIRGYIEPGQMQRGQALAPVLDSHFVDAVQSDNKVKFVNRGGAAVATLTDNDLGWHAGGGQRPPKIVERRAGAASVPYALDFVYIEREHHWQSNVARVKRNDAVTSSRAQTTIETNEVLSADEAAQIVHGKMAEQATAQRELSLSTSSEFLTVEPTDRLSIQYDDVSDTARVMQTDFGGDGVYRMKAVVDDASIYTRFETGNLGNNIDPADIEFPALSQLIIIDTGLLRDQDNSQGYYTASRPRFGLNGTWPGAVVQQAPFSGSGTGIAQGQPSAGTLDWSTIATHDVAAPGGRVASALGDQARWTVIDRDNSLTVTWLYGDIPDTQTDTEFQNNGLVLWVGGQSGGEVIAARDVTDNGDGTVTFSTLLRGRLGTEDRISLHSVGEMAVVLSEDALRNILDAKRSHLTVDASVFLRALTAGEEAGPTTINRVFSNTSRRSQPRSPFYVRRSIDASLNVTFSWTRRTRLREIWEDTLVAPLGEETESYDLEILNSAGTVVRTFTGLTTTSQVYTRAQQIEDAIDEAAPAPEVGAVGLIEEWARYPIGQSSGSPTLDNHDAELTTMDGWTVEGGSVLNVADTTGRPTPQDGVRMFQMAVDSAFSSQIDLAGRGVDTADIDANLLGIDVYAWIGSATAGTSLPGAQYRAYFRFLTAVGSPSALVGTSHSEWATVTQTIDASPTGGWQAYQSDNVAAIPAGTRFIDVGWETRTDPATGKTGAVYVDDVEIRIGPARVQHTVRVYQNSQSENIGRGIGRTATP